MQAKSDIEKKTSFEYKECNNICVHNENKFWELIEKSNPLEDFEFLDKISNSLSKEDEKNIIDFEITLRSKIMELNSWQTFYVLTLFEGEILSDDDFLYFRCWIIYEGKDFYYKFLENPDLVFEIIKERFNSEYSLTEESMLYVADRAFTMKFGEDTEKATPRAIASLQIDYDWGDNPLKGDKLTLKFWEQKIPKLSSYFESVFGKRKHDLSLIWKTDK